ncbi:MAG: DNA polymerase III subunit delta [Cyclobacteriaceae bacterium]|nr:DNA polymerase III subunit delta [Cyclobacteriaceae bacterium]
MRFTDIPGLQEVKQKLVQSVQSNKMAHAQLIAGKEGALNLPLALAYATYIQCQNRTPDDACGVCAACSKNQKYIHPDLHFVFPLSNIKNDKDVDRFKAEITKSWRSFLIEQPFGKLDDWTNSYGGENKQALISREESRTIIKTLSLKSFESPYKIMVIWLPEYMHASAANGILKILEEPPENTFFLLVTNAADRLLPTIVSRTQRIQVPLLTDEDLDSYLQQHASLSETDRRNILQLADGDLNLALRLTQSDDNINQDLFAEWMRACFKKSYADLVRMADDFHQMDKLNQHNLFYYSIGMMRESLLYLAGSTSINRTQGGELKFIQDFSKVLNILKIEKANQLMSSASYFLERNGSAKMIFLNLSLQLSAVLNP